jgi:hypothetical protein
MGFFDLFKGSGKKAGEGAKGKAPAAAKWAERAGDKRAQNYDRQEAIHALSEITSKWAPKAHDTTVGDDVREQAIAELEAASAALLRRFTFVIDPSITDQEEKDAAFSAIVRCGHFAIEPVRAFAAKAESLSWPLRVLKALLPEDEYVAELLLWLSKWDTEYAKFIDPKIQLLATLEDHKHPDLVKGVEPFLLDVNETARYHAVATLLAQDDPSVADALLKALVDEESLRIKIKTADGFIARGWPVSEELRAEVRKNLPSGYTIDGEGLVRRKDTAPSPFGFEL